MSTGRILLAGENRNTRRKSSPNATLSTTDSTWSGLWLNPGLPGEMPAPKLLNRGMAPVSILPALCYASPTDATVSQQLTSESKYDSLPVFLSLYSIAAQATTHVRLPYAHRQHNNKHTFSATIAQSRKALISFAMSDRLSTLTLVCMYGGTNNGRIFVKFSTGNV